MTGLLWVEGVGADLVSGAELVAADAADAGLGVVVHDGAGVIVGANDVAGESLGLSWDQLVGRTSRDRRWSAVSEQGLALTGDQHPAMRTLATGEPVEDFLMGVLIPAGASAGRTQWLSISTYPVGVPVVGVAAVFTDVSGTTVGKVADQMLTSQQSIAAGQRFASMFYGHAAVMLLIDPDTGAIVDANQAAADFYGYTIDELRSMSIDRINVLPDEQVALRRAQALAGDRNHFVFGHQLANGQIRSVQVHSSPIADHGRTLLFSIITDVTERERVEAQLRQAAAVFDNTLESVVITDAAVVVRQVNAAFTDLTGWEPESIVGRHAHVLGRDTTKAEDAQRIRDAIQAGDGVRGEVSIRHRDGAESPALLSVSAIPGPDGEVTGYVGVLSDLSERVRVERVLAEQAQQLESARSALAVENERRELVLSGTRLGLWDWNMVTGETVFDERWAQIVGYQLEDLQPTSIDTWTRFSHPDDLARSDELIKQCVQGLIPFYDAEVRMRHRGGRWVWVHDRGRIVEWTADGRPLRMTGTHEDITELVAARELVQAERVRLRATMDSLMDPHVLLEAVRDEAGMIVDFVYTDANPAACAYTGLDYQDLVGARLLDLLPGQAGSGLLQSYRQVVDTGEPLALDDVAYDQEVLGAQQRFYDLRATRVGDGLSLTWRDITDRHTAAVALAEAQTRYRLLAENATDVVWQVDADTTVRWVTPSVESVLRWRPEQVLGVPTTELVYPQDRAALATWRAAVFAGAAPSPVEIRLLTGDGDYRWMSMQTRPMASPDGSVRGAIVGLRDIHHEVLARQALQVSEQQYRMLAENASDVVAQLDATDALTWVSPSVEQVLGWAPEQIVGANLVELVHRADRAPAAQWRAHLPTDATSDPVELRLLTADGSYRWVSLLARSTTDAAGLVSGRVVGMRDVHEQVLARLALANSQRRYKMLAENATDVVWQLDADTVLQWVTPSVEAVLGWAPEQLLGKAAIDLVHPDDAGTLTSWRAAVFDGTTASGFELRLLTGDGDYRWMSLQARPITGGDGTIDGAVVGLRDIHEQVLAREQLATSERMFRLAMAGAPQGMAVVGLQGQLTQVNEALCQLAGRNLAWMEEHCEYDFIHPDDREADLAARDLLLAGEAEFDIHEGRLVTAAGAVVWVEHSLALIRDEHNTPLFYVSQYQDITAARAAKAQLLHQAQHDQLTGLINRGQLQERISSVVDRGPQSGGVCALLFCDLDYFKNVNDSYGHAGGDDVLRVTAERMASALREGDEVARLGGDEFVIVLSDVHDLSAAVAVAQKVRDAVAEPLPVEAEQVSITLSIGVALATPGIEAHRLLRNADAALYEAKNSGRDRIAVFSNQQ